MRRQLIVVLAVFMAGAAGGWAFAQQQKTSVSPEDFIQIQELLWRNHWGFDFATEDHADLWTSTFTPDAELEQGGRVVRRGAQDVRQMALDYYKDAPTRKMRHFTSTFYIRPTAEGANLQAFWYITTQEPGQTGMRLGGSGRYNSDVVKTSGGWKIKRHRVLGDDAYHGPEEREHPLESVPGSDALPDRSRETRRALEAFVKKSGAAFWIEHDATLFAHQKKSPAFYD